MRGSRIDDISGVAVSTDGLDTLLVEYEQGVPRQPVAAAWHRLFAIADDPHGDEMRLTRVLASADVCRLTEDDKTLAMLVMRP